MVSPLVDNTFQLQLYQVHSVPAVSIMLYKTLSIDATNPYISMTAEKQSHTHPGDMNIMIHLVSRTLMLHIRRPILCTGKYTLCSSHIFQ